MDRCGLKCPWRGNCRKPGMGHPPRADRRRARCRSAKGVIAIETHRRQPVEQRSKPRASRRRHPAKCQLSRQLAAQIADSPGTKPTLDVTRNVDLASATAKQSQSVFASLQTGKSADPPAERPRAPARMVPRRGRPGGDRRDPQAATTARRGAAADRGHEQRFLLTTVWPRRPLPAHRHP